MSQLTASIVRIACNQSSRDAVINKLSGTALSLWKSAALSVQCAVFKADPSKSANFIDDISNVVSAEIIGREESASGTVKLNQVVVAAAMNGALTFDQWSADTAQHFSFHFSNDDMNFALAANKSLYLAIALQLGDGSEVPIATGNAAFKDPGIGDAGDPEAPDYTSYSKLESDARFIQRDYVPLVFFGDAVANQVFDFFKAKVGIAIYGVELSAQIAPVGSNLTLCLVDGANAEIAGTTATLTAGNKDQETIFGAPIALAAAGIVRAKIKTIGSGTAGGYLNAKLITAPA